MFDTQVNVTNHYREYEGQRVDEGTPDPREQWKKDKLYYLESVVFKVP